MTTHAWLMNEDYLKLTQSLIDNKVRVDLIVTDPPYDIPTLNKSKMYKDKGLDESLEDLNQSNLRSSYKIEQFANLVNELQKGKINAYFWCNKKQIPEYLTVYVDFLECHFDILTWHKSNALPNFHNKYLTDTEYCLYFRKGKPGRCWPQTYEDAKTFWFEPINQKDKKLWKHPTIKPVEMIEKMVRNSSKVGDTVYDPFMGSGTTGVACRKLNRPFIGGDLDKQWFEIAKKRIKNGNNERTGLRPTEG